MKYLSIIALCFFTNLAYAQDNEDGDETEEKDETEEFQDLPETDDNGLKYLDDGIRHDAKNEVLLSVTSLVSGFIDIHLTRKITKSISLDFAGMIKSFNALRIYEIINYGDLIDDKKTVKSGVGYGMSFRYNPHRRAMMEYADYGFSYRNRTLTLDYGKILHNQIGIVQAWKRIMPNNFGWEVVSTLGFKSVVLEYNNPSIENEIYALPFYNLSFRIGYYF